MKLSLATRIFLGNALVTLTFGGVSIYSILEMRKTDQEIRLISEGYLRLATAMTQLDSFHRGRQRSTERLLDENSPDIRKAMVRLAEGNVPQHIQDRLEKLKDLSLQTAELAPWDEAPFFKRMADRFDDLSHVYENYEKAARAAYGAFSEKGVLARDSEEAQTLLSMERKLSREIKALVLMLDNQVAERVRIAEKSGSQTTLYIIGLSILAIALGLLSTLLAARLLSPIRTLTDAVRQMGNDPDGEVKFPTDVDGEIGLLANALSAMVDARKEHERAMVEKQEALVRAERLAAIGRISAQITHEIRNPLTSMGLNAEMLEEELLPNGDTEEARKLLKSIIGEIDRLGEISEQYLSFAKFPTPNMQPIDTPEFLDDLLDFHEAELARTGVKIVRAYSQDCPSIVGDDRQLKQAFLNLIRNSREALIHGGTITISARPLVTQVEFGLQDDGPGIQPEALKRMFDPFFSTKERGTGLGLSLTQQIISEHGGELRCESEVGKGTIFHIRLKRAPSTTSSPSSEVPLSSGDSAHSGEAKPV